MRIGELIGVSALLLGAAIAGAALTYALAPMILGRGPAQVAIVDVTAALRTQQEYTAAQLAKAGSDVERQRHLQEAAAFGARLQDAVRQLGEECQCVLLLREAVVAGDAPDLSSRLSALLDKR